MRKTLTLLTLLTCAGLATLRADVVQLTITPAPASAAPGGTAYFGFSLFWQSDTDSLLVVNSYLTNETNPLLGSYTDLMGLNGFEHILGPSAGGESWSEPGGPATGAGFYLLSPLAAIGNSNSGFLAVDYLVLSDAGTTGGTVEAPFSIAVTATAPVAEVPEPASSTLLGLGIAALAVAHRRRTRQRKSLLLMNCMLVPSRASKVILLLPLLALLVVSPVRADMWLPDNYVNLYSYVQTNQGGQAACGNPPCPSIHTYVNSKNLPISTTRSVEISGTYDTNGAHVFVDAGNFTTTQSGSVGADKSLHVYTSILGEVAANRSVIADAMATYYDAVTVTGPTPEYLVFHVGMEGTGTGGHGGSEYLGNLDKGYPYARFSLIANGHPYDVAHPGDGVFRAYDISVPWWTLGGNEFSLGLQLVAFGRIDTFGHDANVNLAVDFSNTASLTGVSVFDAAGNDITSLSNISFQVPATTSAVPEPGSWVLLGSCLLALTGVVRKRALRK